MVVLGRGVVRQRCPGRRERRPLTNGAVGPVCSLSRLIRSIHLEFTAQGWPGHAPIKDEY